MSKSVGEHALGAVGDLRLRRVRTRPSATLEPEMDRALADLKRQRRTLSACAAAWPVAVPPDLLERTALQGFTRGVLTIRVPDAAAKFALDRHLRAGGWKAFARECSATVKSFWIVVGRS